MDWLSSPFLYAVIFGILLGIANWLAWGYWVTHNSNDSSNIIIFAPILPLFLWVFDLANDPYSTRYNKRRRDWLTHPYKNFQFGIFLLGICIILLLLFGYFTTAGESWTLGNEGGIGEPPEISSTPIYLFIYAHVGHYGGLGIAAIMLSMIKLIIIPVHNNLSKIISNISKYPKATLRFTQRIVLSLLTLPVVTVNRMSSVVNRQRRKSNYSHSFPSQDGSTQLHTSSVTDSGDKNSTNPAYVASVADNLTNNAQQTSSASKCAKYLKELRDVLVESDLDGETYEDIMDQLDKLIVRVDSEGFADELDETRVRQIKDIAHRIERMCQRQS